MLAATAALAATGAYDGAEAAALLVVVGLTTGGVLGALLLARRTGPEIVYWRLLDRAPALDDGAEVETAGQTWRRILAPAVAVAVTLTAIAPFLVGAALLLAGEPRGEVLRGMPALAPAAGGAWTAVCGLAGLRMAGYFERWERRTGMTGLVLPLRAGLVQDVYARMQGNPRGDGRAQ